MDVKDVKRAITIITREGVRPPSDIAHQEVDSKQASRLPTDAQKQVQLSQFR